MSRADELLRKMLAIHALDYHEDVSGEAYPGQHHEEAEEAWCREAHDYLRSLDATPAVETGSGGHDYDRADQVAAILREMARVLNVEVGGGPLDGEPSSYDLPERLLVALNALATPAVETGSDGQWHVESDWHDESVLSDGKRRWSNLEELAVHLNAVASKPADSGLRDRLLALLMQDEASPLPNGIVLVQHWFAGTSVKIHEKGATCVICAALDAHQVPS
jgi:hypothetical protein